jgi:hypothetical protein
MNKVGKSDCEGTFAGMRGNDEDAPNAVARASALEQAGSTLSRQRVGLIM